MASTTEGSKPVTFYNEEVPFSIGLKELMFLAFILFFGFCGFTVCIDKIYEDNSNAEIKSITVYDRSLSSVSHKTK